MEQTPRSCLETLVETILTDEDVSDINKDWRFAV